jgi:hypothetical protein
MKIFFRYSNRTGRKQTRTNAMAYISDPKDGLMMGKNQCW